MAEPMKTMKTKTKDSTSSITAGSSMSEPETRCRADLLKAYPETIPLPAPRPNRSSAVYFVRSCPIYYGPGRRFARSGRDISCPSYRKDRGERRKKRRGRARQQEEVRAARGRQRFAGLFAGGGRVPERLGHDAATVRLHGWIPIGEGEAAVRRFLGVDHGVERPRSGGLVERNRDVFFALALTQGRVAEDISRLAACVRADDQLAADARDPGAGDRDGGLDAARLPARDFGRYPVALRALVAGGRPAFLDGTFFPAVRGLARGALLLSAVLLLFRVARAASSCSAPQGLAGERDDQGQQGRKIRAAMILPKVNQSAPRPVREGHFRCWVARSSPYQLLSRRGVLLP
jgi:hypothetical protein